MNDKKDYSDIGYRIQSAVEDAVESMDFGQINRIVTDTVSGAIDEVRRQVDTISQAANQRTYSSGSGTGQNSSMGQNSSTAKDRANTSQKQGNEKAASAQSQSAYERYRYTYRQPGSRTMYASQKRPANTAQSGGQNVYTEASKAAGGTEKKELKLQKSTAVRINHAGKVGGILKIVFGSIGIGVFGSLALSILGFGFLTGALASAKLPVVVMILLGIISSLFVVKGSKTLGRLKRAERYAKLGGKRMFLELEDIARNTGRSLRRVRADVRHMLQLGIFPEGHLDNQETCLILDDETWQQYKITQKEWDRKLLEDKSDKGKKAEKGKKTEKSNQMQEAGAEVQNAAAEKESPEVQIVREGQAYMDRLRQLNIEIPGEVISNKLYQLDYLLTRIFAVIREHPEKCPQMRKFMDYYLPTTVKLVEAYADFDKAGVQGENITSAKTEIEKTMDTINQAFEKLLDDIYLNAAMETTADAQVLKTVLAQDGYTKSDFEL